MWLQSARMVKSLFNLEVGIVVIQCIVFLSCPTGKENNEVNQPIFPEGYNKYQTPLQSERMATPVYLNVWVTEIDEIIEEKMEYSIQFYVNEIWQDPRLNTASLRGDIPTQIPREIAERIWIPDIIFENSKGGWIYPLSIPNTVVSVFPDGHFFRYTRYNMRVSCAMALRNYPMDTQHCYLRICSLANGIDTISLKWIHEKEPGVMGEMDHFNSITFENIHPMKYSVRKPYASSFEEIGIYYNYTVLLAHFNFHRHVGSHIFNVYVPSGLVVILSHMTFWLDVKAVPARVALGLTSLLTLTTQVSQARGKLPPVNYLTALDVWLFACILMVFASIAEFALVHHLINLKKQRKVSNSLPSISEAWETTPSLENTVRSNLSQRDFAKTVGNSQSEISGSSEIEEQYVDRLSRILFPTCFVLFTLMYWMWYLQGI